MYRTNVHSSMSFNDCLQPCNQHDCNRLKDKRRIKETSQDTYYSNILSKGSR